MRVAAARFRIFGLGVLLAATGCTTETDVGSDDTGEPAEVPRDRLCDAAGSSTVTGFGPDGLLDGYHVFANVRGGECRAALEVVLTPEPVLTMPYHPATVVIVAHTPADLLASSVDLTGSLPAAILGRDGQVAAEGKLELLGASPVDGLSQVGLSGVVGFDSSAWRFIATIEVPYCLVDACPCCEIPP